MDRSYEERVTKLVEELTLSAAVITGRTFKVPSVTYDVRGQVAGYARSYEWSIGLNRVLLEENLDSFIEETVPHEFAHLVADSLHGRVGHGKPWQALMLSLGYSPGRCHSYDVRNVVSGGYAVYECECLGKNKRHFLSKRKHLAILRGSRYFCRYCKSPLVLKDSSSISGSAPCSAASQERLPSQEGYCYSCGCQEHFLSKRRHNNITLRGARYLCPLCKALLVKKY